MCGTRKKQDVKDLPFYVSFYVFVYVCVDAVRWHYNAVSILIHSHIYAHHQGWLNNPIFSNLGLCAACWARFMYDHQLWPTSVSHPFSSLNSSLGFAGGKHCLKIIIPIFQLVLHNLAIPGCFPCILFYCYLFFLLPSGWFVIAVCGSVSVREIVKS